MAYENLLKSVEESAEERERELRTRAQEQAAGIRDAAKKQAGEIQEHAIRGAERSAAIERNKELYLARGRIKEESLKNRETIFLAAFGEAEKRLAQVRGMPEYPAIFERLAREAAGAMGTSSFVVHVDKRDADLCARTLAALNIRCRVETDLTCAGGLVAATPDGLTTVSNTIESRLERARELRRQEIYALLFGG